jgi:uncharacterized membrane protein
MSKKPSPMALEELNATGRVEAFSDGVFAIAITLLALNIKPPTLQETANSSLLQQVLLGWPSYLAFVASFFFILVMWINHHRMFKVICRYDNTLLLLNGFLLLCVTLAPFPTQLVAEYLLHPEQATAAMLYSGWFFITSIVFNVLWHHAAYKNRLLPKKTDLALPRRISQQYRLGPLMYSGAFLVASFSPILSLVITVLLAIFYILPSQAFDQLERAEWEG